MKRRSVLIDFVKEAHGRLQESADRLSRALDRAVVSDEPFFALGTSRRIEAMAASTLESGAAVIDGMSTPSGQ